MRLQIAVGLSCRLKKWMKADGKIRIGKEKIRTNDYNDVLNHMNEIVTKTNHRAGFAKGPVQFLRNVSINIDIYIDTRYDVYK